MASSSSAAKGLKAKPNQDGGARAKGVILPDGRKKVDGSGKQVSLSTQKSATVVAKSETKGKSSTNSSKTITKTTKTKTVTVKGRAEKKVYSLPGQKHDPPEEREPLRIFYESLWEQIPSSEMAEFWMMEHGLLSPERAKKAYERKQKRQQQLRMGTPIKSAKQELPESSKNLHVVRNGDVKPKKRVSYSDDGDDFIVKTKRSKG
ncbi:uncharacterized protein [Typha angustifolia]|uniref:uncharacterized protein n=1 Tax=Typha angustifolia TaxID=59011 RepID=UPI003C2F92BA